MDFFPLFSKNYLILTPSIIHPYFNFVKNKDPFSQKRVDILSYNEICSELIPFPSSQIFAGSKKEEEGEINMAFLFLGMPNHQPRGYGLRFSSADFHYLWGRVYN